MKITKKTFTEQEVEIELPYYFKTKYYYYCLLSESKAVELRLAKTDEGWSGHDVIRSPSKIVECLNEGTRIRPDEFREAHAKYLQFVVGVLNTIEAAELEAAESNG